MTDRYFIRYMADGSEKPYRVYFFCPNGVLRRSRSRGHRTADEAAKHVERLTLADQEKGQRQ